MTTIELSNSGNLNIGSGSTLNINAVTTGSYSLTKTGVGTLVAEGKEEKEFDGERYIMERAIVSDISLVKAWKADKSGNLIYRYTARNFNPMVAMAGKITVAEVEEIVENGELDPDSIHTPGIYVHRLVLNATPEKRIEQRTLSAA